MFPFSVSGGKRVVITARSGQFWFFAPVFIHFSLIHLVFNCLWIYVLGQQIEKIDGKILFITLIIFFSSLNTLAFANFESEENFVSEEPKNLENMTNPLRNRQCHLAFPH